MQELHPDYLRGIVFLTRDEIIQSARDGLISLKEGSRNLVGTTVPDSIGPMSLSLHPAHVWNGKKFVPIDGKYSLKPRSHIIVHSREQIILGTQFAALHFGRFAQQVKGVTIGSGLIEPGWGSTEMDGVPVYISVWNNSSVPYDIAEAEAISHLVLIQLKTPLQFPQPVPPNVIIGNIQRGFSSFEREERNRRFRLAAFSILGMFIAAFAFILGPTVYPILHQSPISEGFAGILLALFSVSSAQLGQAIRGKSE